MTITDLSCQLGQSGKVSVFQIPPTHSEVTARLNFCLALVSLLIQANWAK